MSSRSREICGDRSPEVDAKRAAYIESLRLAHAARQGATPRVEAAVRAYARAMREAGVAVGAALVAVKDLARAHTGNDEPLFTPKVVGWAVAGFFAGTGNRATDKP